MRTLIAYDSRFRTFSFFPFSSLQLRVAETESRKTLSVGQPPIPLRGECCPGIAGRACWSWVTSSQLAQGKFHAWREAKTTGHHSSLGPLTKQWCHPERNRWCILPQFWEEGSRFCSRWEHKKTAPEISPKELTLFGKRVSEKSKFLDALFPRVPWQTTTMLA